MSKIVVETVTEEYAVKRNIYDLYYDPDNLTEEQQVLVLKDREQKKQKTDKHNYLLEKYLKPIEKIRTENYEMSKPIHEGFYTDVTEIAMQTMKAYCLKHNENILRLRAIAESIPEEDKKFINNDHNLSWYYKEHHEQFCSPKAVYAMLLNDFCKEWWSRRDYLKDEDFPPPDIPASSELCPDVPGCSIGAPVELNL